MAHKSLPEQRRRELEQLAAARRADHQPPARTAAELATLGGISRLWAWRLATGWRRSELLARLRQLGDPSVDESMLWRWELGERDPNSDHLDRLCRVYQTRPDLLGYGHDYTPQATPSDANLALPPLDNEPSAIIDQARARHTLTRAAAWFGCQLGLALWPHDQPAAAVYLEAALAVAGQADDPELADWVLAQQSASETPDPAGTRR